jgi:hypothetical protein
MLMRGTRDLLRLSLLTCAISLTLVASSNAQQGRLTPGPEIGDYIVKPSVTSSPLCHQENQIPVDLYCRDGLGVLTDNCDIEITFQRVPRSGWHDHVEPNGPPGTFDRTSGKSGSGPNPTKGRLRLFYTAPEAAGEIRVSATGNLPNGDPIVPTEFPVFTIRFDFGWLFDWPFSNYTLTGFKPWHPENHSGKLSLIDATVELANWYAREHPGYKLAINDMSMPDGGVFDICVDPHYQSKPSVCPEGAGSIWKPSHKSHRCGMDVDIDPVPRAHQLKFRQKIETDKTTWPTKFDHGGNHWHLRRADTQS